MDEKANGDDASAVTAALRPSADAAPTGEESEHADPITTPPKAPIAQVLEQRERSATGAAESGASGEHGAPTHEPGGKAAGVVTASEEDASPIVTGGPMEEVPLEFWSSLSLDERVAYWNTTDQYFHALLEDFRTYANDAVNEYTTLGGRYARWRIWLIIATGGLAVCNVLATSGASAEGFHKVMSGVAAVYAVLLALLTNIESFLNLGDKRTSIREARELYLDAYREFETLRLTYVYPYGYTAIACRNFSDLYRRLVARDAELRRKIMQRATTRNLPSKE